MQNASAAVVQETATALPPGSRVGEYEIIDVLAEGLNSIVYRARDRSGSGDVAVKEYLPSRIARRDGHAVTVSSPRESALFSAGRRNFLRQARQLPRVCHPSLAAVLQIWGQNGTAYVAMPLYRGQMLDRALADSAFQPTQDWLERFARPLLDLLTVLHRRGFYGVDLSPSNVMLIDGKHPVVMSFGRRWIEQADGSPWPMPPGIARMDVQALARLLQQLIASGAHSQAYPERFVKAVGDAAEGEPARRPYNVEAFMTALGFVDRRQRVRSAAESLLARATRVHAGMRRSTPPDAMQADTDGPEAVKLAPAQSRSRPPTRVPTRPHLVEWGPAGERLIGAGAVAEDDTPPALPAAARPTVRRGRMLLVAATAIALALGVWLRGDRGDGASSERRPTPAAVAEIPTPVAVPAAPQQPVPAVAEAPLPGTPAAALPPSGSPLGSPLDSLPSVAAPEPREQSELRAAGPDRPRTARPPATRPPRDARCSELLFRISLGESRDLAADTAYLDQFCR
jgi:hypothetical protein